VPGRSRRVAQIYSESLNNDSHPKSFHSGSNANRRPPPHTRVWPRPARVVSCLGKCKSSILSGLPQARYPARRSRAPTQPECRRERLFAVNRSPRGKALELGFTDPDHVEVHLAMLYDISRVELLKIRCSLRRCSGNKDSPSFMAEAVYRVAVDLSRSAESSWQALYCPASKEPEFRSEHRVLILTEPFNGFCGKRLRPRYFFARYKRRDHQFRRKVGREWLGLHGPQQRRAL